MLLKTIKFIQVYQSTAALRVDQLPANVTLDESAFLATVTIEV